MGSPRIWGMKLLGSWSFGEVAQLAEHAAENRGVDGSIPSLATNWSQKSEFGGSNSRSRY